MSHKSLHYYPLSCRTVRFINTLQNSYHNHLDPSIIQRPWTPEEQRIVADAHKELGNRWAEIAKRLPGRSQNGIKNFWYSFMRKNVRKLNRDVGSVSLPPNGSVSGLSMAAVMQANGIAFGAGGGGEDDGTGAGSSGTGKGRGRGKARTGMSASAAASAAAYSNSLTEYLELQKFMKVSIS